MWKQAGNKCPHLNGAYALYKSDKLFTELGQKAKNFAFDELVDPET